MPFTSSASLEVMQTFHLPRCLLKAVRSGIARIACLPGPVPRENGGSVDPPKMQPQRIQNCMLRSPVKNLGLNRGQNFAAALSWNFATALSWNPETDGTSVFITGLTEREERSFLAALEDAMDKPLHPLQVMVILSSMILEGDALKVQRHSDGLADFEWDVRTRVYRDIHFFQDEDVNLLSIVEKSDFDMQTKKLEATASLDFDEATKDLDNTWFGLSYYQMRVETIGRFAEHIAENEKVFRKHSHMEPEELLASLQHLKDGVKALLSEIAHSRTVVQGQKELVSV